MFSFLMINRPSYDNASVVVVNAANWHLVKTANNEAKKTIRLPRFSRRTVSHRLHTNVG
jgi:hypothetical protein